MNPCVDLLLVLLAGTVGLNDFSSLDAHVMFSLLLPALLEGNVANTLNTVDPALIPTVDITDMFFFLERYCKYRTFNMRTAGERGKYEGNPGKREWTIFFAIACINPVRFCSGTP